MPKIEGLPENTNPTLDDFLVMLDWTTLTAQRASFSNVTRALGWVDVANYTTLAAADNAASSGGGKTLLITQACILTANTILTSSVKVLKGGSFVKASTFTLTINGPFEAGLYQVFSGFDAGDVTFGNGVVEKVYIEWWGTNSAALQAAIQCSSPPIPIQLLRNDYTFATTINLTPGDVEIPSLTMLGTGMGDPTAAAYGTTVTFTGTGYLFDIWNTAGTPGAFGRFTLGKMLLKLGTSGTGILQVGNLVDAYNGDYFRNNWHLYDLYLVGDVSAGNWRAGTIGISSKQIGSSLFENIHIHNFETCWIQDTFTENVYNKVDLNTFNNGLDIRGQTEGADKSTFINPDIHGPHGSAVNGYALKVNAGGITMINALYEPNGAYTGSGNNLIWLLYYSVALKDIGGAISIADEAVAAFDNLIKVDQMGGGYIFDDLNYAGSIAGPAVTIAAPDVNAGSIGRFINCSPQLRTIIRNIAANIGRYAWIGPGGTSNDYYFDAPNLYITPDFEGSIVWNPGSLIDGAGETSSNITVTGANFGDYVVCAPPAGLQGILCSACVEAENIVQIRLQNETGGTIDLASGTWKVKVFK